MQGHKFSFGPTIDIQRIILQPVSHISLFFLIDDSNINLFLQFFIQNDFGQLPTTVQECVLAAISKTLAYFHNHALNSLLLPWLAATVDDKIKKQTTPACESWSLQLMACSILLKWSLWDTTCCIRQKTKEHVVEIEDRIRKSQQCLESNPILSQVSGYKRKAGMISGNLPDFSAHDPLQLPSLTYSSSKQLNASITLSAIASSALENSDVCYDAVVSPDPESVTIDDGWVDDFVWQSLFRDRVMLEFDETKENPEGHVVDVQVDSRNEPVSHLLEEEGLQINEDVDVDGSNGGSMVVNTDTTILADCCTWAVDWSHKRMMGTCTQNQLSRVVDLLCRLANVQSLWIYVECVMRLQLWMMSDDCCVKLIETMIAACEQSGITSDANIKSDFYNDGVSSSLAEGRVRLTPWHGLCAGLVLPKIRTMTSPATRTFMRCLELIVRGGALDCLVECVVARSMQPLTTTVIDGSMKVSTGAVTSYRDLPKPTRHQFLPGSVQWELVQRISKQILHPSKAISALLQAVFDSSSSIVDSFDIISEKSSLFQIRSLHSVSAVDIVMVVDTTLMSIATSAGNVATQPPSIASTTTSTSLHGRDSLIFSSNTTSLAKLQANVDELFRGGDGVGVGVGKHDDTHWISRLSALLTECYCIKRTASATRNSHEQRCNSDLNQFMWDTGSLRAINSMFSMCGELHSSVLSSMLASIDARISQEHDQEDVCALTSEAWIALSTLLNTIITKQAKILRADPMLKQDLQRILTLLTASSLSIASTSSSSIPRTKALMPQSAIIVAKNALTMLNKL